MVSVIIPNFNHAAYLKQRIDSVLNQTWQNFELIILDDCSTDNSKEIMEQYRNNIKISNIVYNTENSGSPFKQWDKGIGLANGEYIWIAESDDWCEPNFLQTVMEGLDKKDDTVFGYCQSFCIDDEERIIFQSNYIKLDDYCLPTEYLERFLCFGNAVFNASMAVFKKVFYNKISEFYKSFKFAGDWVFWAELSRLGTIYINARPLNYFRKHRNDITGKMNSSGQNIIEELKALDYFHKRLHLNNAAYFKAKVKLYNRFLTGRSKLDVSVRRQIKRQFFDKIDFVQKQYFLFITRSYQFRLMLNKKINTAFH